MRNKKFEYEVILFFVLSAALIFCGCAGEKSQQLASTTAATAGEAQTQKIPTPAATAGQVRSVTATVDAIDYQTRHVTLKMPDGSKNTVAVGEAAYNFDQVKVGDLVNITITQAVAVMLDKETGGQPGVRTSSGLERAPKGQKPEGVAYSTIDVNAKVVGIDYKQRIVTLVGPDGNEVPVSVDPGVQGIENIKVGDIVAVKYTEAVAISVKPAKQ